MTNDAGLGAAITDAAPLQGRRVPRINSENGQHAEAVTGLDLELSGLPRFGLKTPAALRAAAQKRAAMHDRVQAAFAPAAPLAYYVRGPKHSQSTVDATRQVFDHASIIAWGYMRFKAL